MRRRLLAPLVVTAAAAALVATPASAHGLGERYDLPLPLNMFLAGSAATVALSFVIIGLFVGRRSGRLRYPTLDLLGVRWLGPALGGRLLPEVVRLLSVGVMVVVLTASLVGENSPLRNIAPTFIWIIWWVGMGYVSALLGNVWMLVNPWKIVYEWVESVSSSGSPTVGSPGLFTYPRRADVWPALVLFLLFAWVENVYWDSVVPLRLGMLMLVYSVVTWGGMIAFGKHQWLRRGDPFSVLFGFFARFSPTEVSVADRRVCRRCSADCDAGEGECVDCYECFERAGRDQRRLNVRPYAVGLVVPVRPTTATAVFVVVALATVTFDGLTATRLWLEYQNTFFPAARPFGIYAVVALNSAGLVLLPAVFLSVYLVFAWGIRGLSGQALSVREVARDFVFSLVPIALAYNLAHFVSLLAIQGQYIIPLISDPLGNGWDLLGTADYRVNLAAVSARTVWFVSVGAIVLGHIVSVYIAHTIALDRVGDRASALRSQYPMLVLMVGYTATSLWIIAQPIVN